MARKSLKLNDEIYMDRSNVYIRLFAFFQRSVSENSLVAMDFSGQKTRVIDNPTEALSVAVEEGLAWRVPVASFSSNVHGLSVLSKKLSFTFVPFLAQKKGCLRLGNHGSPTVPSQSSAVNMGMSAFSQSDVPLDTVTWHRTRIACNEVMIPSDRSFSSSSSPPLPAMVSPQNF